MPSATARRTAGSPPTSVRRAHTRSWLVSRRPRVVTTAGARLGTSGRRGGSVARVRTLVGVSTVIRCPLWRMWGGGRRGASAIPRHGLMASCGAGWRRAILRSPWRPIDEHTLPRDRAGTAERLEGDRPPPGEGHAHRPAVGEALRPAGPPHRPGRGRDRLRLPGRDRPLDGGDGGAVQGQRRGGSRRGATRHGGDPWRRRTTGRPTPGRVSAGPRHRGHRRRRPGRSRVGARSLLGSPTAPRRPAAGQPAAWRMANESLTVFDSNGATLFEHPFGFAVPSSSSSDTRPAEYGSPPVLIADIDEDGRDEVLVSTNAVERANRRLYCFEADGRTRFVHQPTGTRRFGDDEYAEPWLVSRVFLTRGPGGSRRLWVVSTHNLWFPSVVQELDPHGAVRQEYWSNGFIIGVVETSWNGRPVVLVGATNNDFRAASLAVFPADARHRVGARGPAGLRLPQLPRRGAGGVLHLPFALRGAAERAGRPARGLGRARRSHPRDRHPGPGGSRGDLLHPGPRREGAGGRDLTRVPDPARAARAAGGPGPPLRPDRRSRHVPGAPLGRHPVRRAAEGEGRALSRPGPPRAPCDSLGDCHDGQDPHRAQPHRRSPRGDGLRRPLQLRPRPQARRAVHPAHRGHRPRAQLAGERGHDLRGPALAGPAVGRGPRRRRPPRALPPERAHGDLPRARRGARAPRRRLPLLLHPRAARRAARGAEGAEGELRLRRPLPRPAPGRGRAAPGGGRAARRPPGDAAARARPSCGTSCAARCASTTRRWTTRSC